MFYQQIQDNENTQELISQFLGYNHNYRISSGEWYDMENLSADNYPVMTPRKRREILTTAKSTIRGILFSDNKLTYLDGNDLHNGSAIYELESYFRTGSTTNEKGDTIYTYDTSEQTLIRFGAYIVLFPSGLWVNTTDGSIGTITSEYSVPVGTTVTYRLCNASGDSLQGVTASQDAPANPKDGDYWLRTTEGAQGLYMWYGYLSSWQAVATCYIYVEIPGSYLPDYFSEGDAVYMNSTLSDINEGSIIQSIKDDHMIIIGFLPDVEYTETTAEDWTLTIKRKMPELDHVCVSNNRVWGCHYGDDYNGNIVNEIYASKLGDFKNWYCYAGLSTDSYALSIGDPGEFTGCINYQGYPTFFKEDRIYKLYGSMPSEYTLSQNTCRGVQRGSEKSLCVVNEYLVYKSPADICVYDGSSPTSISNALGRRSRYYEACAAGSNGKYYISMETASGSRINLIYDMSYGLWMKNDARVKYTGFAQSEAGQVYGTDGTKIYGIAANDNIIFWSATTDEELVEWYAETGDMGLDYSQHKVVRPPAIRAYLPYASELTVSLSSDDGPWKVAGTYRGNNKTETITVAGFPPRCDHYRLRLSGRGDVRVYSISITLEPASEGKINGFTH